MRFKSSATICIVSHSKINMQMKQIHFPVTRPSHLNDLIRQLHQSLTVLSKLVSFHVPANRRWRNSGEIFCHGLHSAKVKQSTSKWFLTKPQVFLRKNKRYLHHQS